MELQGKAIILNTRQFNDNLLLVKLFCQKDGVKCALHNKPTKKQNISLQKGNIVDFSWRGKNDESLGFFKIESNYDVISDILDNSFKLITLNSLLDIIDLCLPENEKNTHFYGQIEDFIHNLGKNNNYSESQNLLLMLYQYFMLEIEILKIIGYELETSVCAVSGVSENLYYISPETGKAATRESGKAYHNKLLKMPILLKEDITNENITNLTIAKIIELTIVTRFFLVKYVNNDLNKKLPYYSNLLLKKLREIN